MSTADNSKEPRMPPVIFDFVAREVVVVDNPTALRRWNALLGAQVKPR